MRWSTRCYSSSLSRLVQPRVKDHGLPCLTLLAGGVVIGQESGCTPLTDGRCRDCLVWDVDEACRTTAVFALTRGFERMCAASNEKRAAYDTDASPSCEEKQTRRDRRQADVPVAVDGAFHFAPQHQILVCNVHVLDGTERGRVKKNVHIEARDARCPHVHRRAS